MLLTPRRRCGRCRPWIRGEESRATWRLCFPLRLFSSFLIAQGFALGASSFRSSQAAEVTAALQPAGDHGHSEADEELEAELEALAAAMDASVRLEPQGQEDKKGRHGPAAGEAPRLAASDFPEPPRAPAIAAEAPPLGAKSEATCKAAALQDGALLAS